MKDERVGAFAVVGGVLLLLIKFLALWSAQDRLAACLLAPMLGRWGMVLTIVLFPYARPEGLGRSMKDHAGWREMLLATLIAPARRAGWPAKNSAFWRWRIAAGATWCRRASR